MAKSLMFHLTDQMLDPEGRFLFLKGTWRDKPVTLANVYCANSKRVSFLREVLLKLTSFHMGLLILGGDFNMALDPLLDTSTGTSSFPFSALRQVKLQLALLMLHDTWRTLNPRERDYTFFSSPHNRYSRLDYLFIRQSDLTYLAEATIENMVLSDHHPITLTLQFPQKMDSIKTWRLNASTLADPRGLESIRQALINYFCHNDTPEVSPMTQLEAHKCVLQGHLLAIAARKKKEHQALLLSLSKKISQLEAQHKYSQAIQLARRARRGHILSHKVFYEQGNKPGKLLARFTQKSILAHTVHHVTDSAGTIYSKNKDIA